MYHEDVHVNDVILSIFNDGDGSLCGMSYKDRSNLSMTEYGLVHYRNAVRTCSKHLKKHFGNPMLTLVQQVEAADLIQKYYQTHMKEMK